MRHTVNELVTRQTNVAVWSRHVSLHHLFSILVKRSSSSIQSYGDTKSNSSSQTKACWTPRWFQSKVCPYASAHLEELIRRDWLVRVQCFGSSMQQEHSDKLLKGSNRSSIAVNILCLTTWWRLRRSCELQDQKFAASTFYIFCICPNSLEWT